MSVPSGAPAGAGVLFPDLAGTSEPAPPPRPRGSRLWRTLARIALWSLIALGALRGLFPTAVPAPARVASPDQRAEVASPDQRAEAVATAFIREYLTLGGDRDTRAERLGRFTVAGLDLRRSVTIPAGTTQYADQVVASGSHPVSGGVEVKVVAHLLQIRSGTYHDAGILAFTVPLIVRREGVAVSGRPRPASLPVAPGLSLERSREPPNELSRAARRAARQAVSAFVAADPTILTDLGGDRPPSTRPLPTGWVATAVGDAEIARTPGGFIAQVRVRARPPTGQASYVVPVHVHLETGPAGITVRHVDGGGPP